MLGDKQLSLVPVAISLMTSCTSSLTMLGSSAELYYQGPAYGFVFIANLLCGPITAYTILPVFHRMNELSLYRVSLLDEKETISLERFIISSTLNISFKSC